MSTAPAPAVTAVDPWFVGDGSIDRQSGNRIAEELARIAEEHPELAPTAEEIAAADGLPTVPAVSDQVPAPAVATPEVITLSDGATITKDIMPDGVHRAILDGNDGSGPEIFYGATDDALMNNVLVGKLNATRKIREQNKKLQVGNAPATAPAPAPPPAGRKDFTADEIFELKTKLADNPALALETWFQIRTGMTVEQLTKLADDGRAAKMELYGEQEAQAFLASHPDYYPIDKNQSLMFQWLNANKKELNRNTLAEAFDSLFEAGLLEAKPTAPTPTLPAPAPVAPTPVAPVAPAPTPSDARIVQTVRRPRVGLGIHSGDVTTVPAVDSDRPLTVEEADDLPDDVLFKLIEDTRKLHAARR